MSLTLRTIDLFVLNLRTRMPFRPGIALMTRIPRLMVKLAAENLVPKWFTKDPAATMEQDLPEMMRVIKQARALAIAIGEAPRPYVLWRDLQDRQQAWARGRGIAPLLASRGAGLDPAALVPHSASHP